MSARRFELHRDTDVSGISGTGVVAEGVAFTDGTVALRWCSEWPTSVVFHDRGVEAVVKVHGPGGSTRIVWLDVVGPPAPGVEWSAINPPLGVARAADATSIRGWHCAKCRGDSDATGGPSVAICRHVAQAGGYDEGGEGEEVVIFASRRPDGFDTQHCGDRDCPTVEVCIGCWDNLYVSEEDDAKWIARAFVADPA